MNQFARILKSGCKHRDSLLLLLLLLPLLLTFSEDFPHNSFMYILAVWVSTILQLQLNSSKRPRGPSLPARKCMCQFTCATSEATTDLPRRSMPPAAGAGSSLPTNDLPLSRSAECMPLLPLPFTAGAPRIFHPLVDGVPQPSSRAYS